MVTLLLPAQAQDRQVASTHKSSPSINTIIMPEENQVNVELLITQILRQHHYRKIELNDSISSVILDNYIASLDGDKIYFLASDIENFEQYRNTLDDDLKSGNLVPAFHIYNIFKKRFIARNEYVNQLVEKDFDFTVDEYYETDRENASWASSEKELNEVWRKLIKSQALSLKLSDKKEAEINEMLKTRYSNMETAISEYNSEDVFQIYMNSFTESFDPHTSYFSPSTSENFKIAMSQSLEGIGASLQRDSDYTKVAELVPGGPAFKSKELQKNDRITGVAQGKNGEMVDVIGWRLNEVVKLIRGPKGTVVRLQILPALEGANATPVEISLVRDKIKLEEQAAKKEIIKVNKDNKEYSIGVITIPTFYMDFEEAQKGNPNYTSTTRDVKKLIRELEKEKIDGLVIDLRYNGGGSLTEAIELSGLFIEDGPVVQVKNANGSIEVAEDPDPELFYDGPLGVLTNRFSASASEIFAGAIQDYDRGVVIGEQSYGKGTVQNLLDLARFLPGAKGESGQVKVTLAKFYRVTGSSTQHKGVTPDIELPSVFSAEEFGESSQPSALPWDKIVSAKFKSTDMLSDKVISQLRTKYQQRLATDSDLQALVKDTEMVKKAREESKLSLMETKRIKEREEEKERRVVSSELNSTLDMSEVPKKEEEKKEEMKDPYLKEGLNIMADLISSIG
jgi:carboxyl-terminal processing protease